MKEKAFTLCDQMLVFLQILYTFSIGAYIEYSSKHIICAIAFYWIAGLESDLVFGANNKSLEDRP